MPGTLNLAMKPYTNFPQLTATFNCGACSCPPVSVLVGECTGFRGTWHSARPDFIPSSSQFRYNGCRCGTLIMECAEKEDVVIDHRVEISKVDLTTSTCIIR